MRPRLRTRPVRPSLERLEDRTTPAGFYDLDVVADTRAGGSATFRRFGDLVSINNDATVVNGGAAPAGTVAFVGYTKGAEPDQDTGGLWVERAGFSPTNVNPQFSDSGRDFGRAVDINDAGRLVARDQIGTQFFVRTWASGTADEHTNVASANNVLQPDYGQFSALQTFTDINGRGDVAYIGLSADGTYRSLILKLASESQPRPFFTLPFEAQVPRPQLTDDGRVLYRAQGAGTLALLDPATGVAELVTSGFGELATPPASARTAGPSRSSATRGTAPACSWLTNSAIPTRRCGSRAAGRTGGRSSTGSTRCG